MAGIKIVDLPALGRDLLSTDLLEMSIGGTASRKITGQEIMNASKLNVGSTPIVSGTVGRVLFQGTGNILQQSANLFWDNTISGLQLQTENISSSQRGLLVSQFNSGQQAPLISFQKARGTIATPTDVITGDLVGFFQFSARMGGAYTVDRASFGANAASTSGIGVFIIGGSSNGIYNPGIYVHPSNNVTIGSSQSILTGITDAGFRLDVNGTARVQGNTTVALNQNAITSLNVSNTTNGTASQSRINLTSNNGSFILGKNSTTTNTYKTLLSDDAIVYNTSSDISILNDFASGRIKFATGGVSTPQMTIFSTGNVLINTTTDAGFRLDVNGTARVSGQVDIAPGLTTMQISSVQQINSRLIQFNTNGASGGWSAGYEFRCGFNNSYGTTTAFRIWSNSATNNRIGVGDISESNLQGGNAQVYINSQITGGRNAGVRITPPSTSTTEFSGIQFDIINKDSNGGAFIGSQYNPLTNGYDTDLVILTTGTNPNSYSQTARFMGKYNSFYVGTDKTLAVPSAKMQVESTTQGFLPPRMTNAQRTAIVSPAVGLIVYCTDVTEGLWVYKSTGWTFIV